jgi:branched-subunit amino acid transport protein
MITLSKLVENCLQAVAIALLTLLCIPGLATALGVDVAGSAVAIAVVVSCLALILPKIKRMAIPAYAKRAMQARRQASQRINDESR